MTALFADLRYGLRMLIGNFRLTLLAGTILGLAIGGGAAIFSLIDVIFLRPLGGIAAPKQLIELERVQPGLSAENFAYPDYLAYRDNNDSFSGLAAHCPAPIGVSGTTTQRIRGDLVTGNYFSVLGVKPALGRLLIPADDARPGSVPVAVLSYGLWRSAFASDAAIIGKPILVNGHPFTIVGVADPNFTGTQVGQPTGIWIPLSMQAQDLLRLSAGIFDDRAAGWLDVFGRLKPGIGLERAQTDLSTTAARLGKNFPITNAHRRVRVLPGVGVNPDDQADIGKLLGLLFAAVAILLATAAANVATLLLGRAVRRRRETAIRLAIGGSPARIVRQLLVEALLLSSVAGALGLFITPWVSGLMASFRKSSYILRGVEPNLDWRLIVFVVILVCATGALLGLAPALESCKIDLASSLQQTTRTSSTRRSRKQHLLVAFQLALSFLLLTGTGLMLKTMSALMSIAPGFDSHNVLLMSMDLSIQGYSEPRAKQFQRSLLNRVAALPGVRSASLSQTVPPQEFGSRVSLFHPGQVLPLDMLRGREFELGFRVDSNFIAPDYFRTLAIPLLSGRDFDPQDDESRPPVAIVNRALAERMWPNQEAVGKQVVWPSFSGPPRPPLTVVGLVGNTRQRSLALEPPMVVYVPIAQSYVSPVRLIIRTANDPALMARQIREQISILDKTLPVFGTETLQEHFTDSLWRQRATLHMIGAFGALSLIVAAVGLYGVISQWVLQRTRDTGIRIALGASRADVIKMVLRRSFMLVLPGIGAGLLGTLLLAETESAALAGITYSVHPADPGVIAGVSLLLLCIAFAAALFPALRALQADPSEALRTE